MNKTRLISFLVLAAFELCSAAFADDLKQNRAYSKLVVGQDKGVEYQLEARQIPLAQVLDRIAKQTQIPIHYSVLPEGLVTATCVGSSFRQVLACVLDHKADLIVRYKRPNETTAGHQNVAEAWILGARMDGYPVTRIDCIADAQASLALQQKEEKEAAEAKEIESLLIRANSKVPAERADAIGALLAVEHEGDTTITATLEKALHDEDASVRAQAISTFSRREGASAKAALQAALHDNSPEVRMMAVDGITDDMDLLQEAINDSDETVRNLAAKKLDDLTKQQKKP